jgi:hypothetical protein
VIRPALAVALALAATPALAASPRWGTVDVGMQGYYPNIDSEFPTRPGVYETMFGSGRGWMFQLGISRALFTKVGSLELGLRTGYFQDKGKGIVAGTNPPTRSADDTTFKIVPTSLALTYRFDWLADRWNVPLAPYGRAALERYNWWTTGGSGSWSKEGGTNGWSVTGGIGFLLDFLDPTLARELDQDSGVNHTFLYAEITKSRIDDFGSSKSWDLSDEKLSLAFGLSFVF